MPLLLLVSTIAVLAGLWMLYNAAVKRRNKFAIWLGLLLVGMAVIMSGNLEVSTIEKVAVNTWVLLVLGLPLYWAVRGIVRAWRS
jgi:hypothetical protein